MSELMQRIQQLTPEKLDRLLRQLKPGSTKLATAASAARSASKRRPFRPATDENYRLEIEKPGILDTLGFRLHARTAPRIGEMEIEVHAASLNFRDIMIALGTYPLTPGLGMPMLGFDCAGVVVTVGPGNDTFKAGDKVMCITKGGFARFNIAERTCTMPMARGFTFEEASAVPGVFTTAYYALVDLGHLSKTETVLIHSAAGGVGMAAIQVAQWVGARVLATTGTPEKREFLRSMGIEHVFDSRSNAFAKDVMNVTDGQGVDVVLNSLSGEAIPTGIELLRPLGRFLELGKRDFIADSRLSMRPFLRGLSFIAVDIGMLSPLVRPDIGPRVHREVGALFQTGVFKPLPMRLFPIDQIREAFSYMMQGSHIGKIVFPIKDQQVTVDL
jgi:myxalamid-type polyketide synthase MxaF